MTRNLLLTLSILLLAGAAAVPFIVNAGEARAEIVLAEDAPRQTRPAQGVASDHREEASATLKPFLVLFFLSYHARRSRSLSVSVPVDF